MPLMVTSNELIWHDHWPLMTWKATWLWPCCIQLLSKVQIHRFTFN